MATESKTSQDIHRPRGPNQFSVRDLLLLTAGVSVVLTTVVLSRGSLYVGFLAAPWTWVSFTPVALAWFFGRRPGARRWLVRGSILAFVVSLCVPAIALGSAPNVEAIFGGQAWLQSYAFGLGYLQNVVLLRTPRVDWPVDEREMLACALGAIANSFLVAGWIAVCVARRKRKRPIAARWLARAAFVLMFAALIPIATTGDLFAIYPGFGLWAASALMLALRY